MSTLEHGEQVEFVRWFRARFSTVMIYAIPNGGKRSITEAKRLKEEGVVPGMPDLHIPVWRLWVEMKREKGGRLSEDQKDVLDYLQTIGDAVIVAKVCEDATKQTLEFLKDKR